MNPDQVLDQIIQANPKPAEGQAPGMVLTRAALLAELDRRSGEMQTQDRPASQRTTQDKFASRQTTQDKLASQQTKPTSPPRQRRLVPALAGAAAVTVALAIGVVLLNSDSGTAPAAPVPVVVSGTEQWTDTGIDVSVDDTVLIEADGAVTPSQGGEPLYGPDGVPDRPSARRFNIEGLPEANHAGLIGRIGEAGAPFVVGSQHLSVADTEGRLFLGINDEDVANNAGEFTATITVSSP